MNNIKISLSKFQRFKVLYNFNFVHGKKAYITSIKPLVAYYNFQSKISLKNITLFQSKTLSPVFTAHIKMFCVKEKKV